jgi:hypothetical protein
MACAAAETSSSGNDSLAGTPRVKLMGVVDDIGERRFYTGRR